MIKLATRPLLSTDEDREGIRDSALSQPRRDADAAPQWRLESIRAQGKAPIALRRCRGRS